MNCYIYLGDKIEYVFERKDNYEKIIGYNIKGIFDGSKQPSDIIRYWSSLLFNVDNIHEGIYNDKYLNYYIYDSNIILSPTELHQKLLNMTEFNNHSVKVKNCIITSKIPFDIEKEVFLRFFVLSKETFSAKEIKDIISKDPRFTEVKCSSKEGIRCGYGFVKLKNRDDFHSLENQIVVIDDLQFYFK